jgi:hypothetical protein
VLAPASQQECDCTHGAASVEDQPGCDATAPYVADLNCDGHNAPLAPCVTGSVVFATTRRAPA